MTGPASSAGVETLAGLRGAATRRLLALDGRGEFTSEHVRVVAACLGVHERTVWRWVERARAEGRCDRRVRARFTITDELRSQLALFGGNASWLYRELKAREADGGPAAPSLRTVYRAVERDLTRGEIAGIRKGENARRRFDVYLRRPRGPGHEDASHRNLVWEGDHVEASVLVDVEGTLRKPWVTWFVDCATNAVCGLAVTPVYPSRESILAALRSAIVRDAPYGPVGGLPAAVRVDQGRDFLSKTVGQALGRFAVPVGELPGYHPHLKGTVEELNGAVKKMLFTALPRYVHAPTLLGGKRVDPGEPALMFAGFVELLLDWVTEWNRVLPKPVLGGLTPEQAWLADPTPLDEVPAGDLRLMTLEDDGRARVVTTKGVSWRSRYYVGPWMTGVVGARVRLRYMPHHDHEVEVFDAATGRHLGAAHLADAATREQVGAVMAARRAAAVKLTGTLKEAARRRRERYAAVTTPQRAQRLGALTSAEADAELQEAYHDGLRSLAKPGLFPLPDPDPGWVRPGPPRMGGVAGDPDDPDHPSGGEPR